MKDIFPRHGFYWILLNKQSKSSIFQREKDIELLDFL